MDKAKAQDHNMIVGGGFYTLIHLIIIIANRTIRLFVMNRLLSYAVINIVILLVLFSVYSLASGAMEESPNISLYAKLFYSCEPIRQLPAENKIILRVDDIQAFAWSDVQKRMIADAISRGIPPVLGVIPFGIENDKELYRQIYKNRCNLEIAQHGWNHGMDTFGMIPEFGGLDRQAAYDRIMKGKPMLEKLAGRELTTFIPPNNVYSQNTALALQDAGFKIISGQEDSAIGYTASTFDSQTGELTPISEIISYCKKSLAEINLCVIMAHPQDYAADGALNDKKYGQYLALLDSLKELEAMFVKISDLADNGIYAIDNKNGAPGEESGRGQYVMPSEYLPYVLENNSVDYPPVLEIMGQHLPLSANSASIKLNGI